MEFRIKVPSLRAVLPFVLALVVVGGFMALDRTVLHWYAPSDDSARVEALEADLRKARGEVSQLKSDVSSLEASGIGDEFTAGALARIATAVTLNSLVTNLGGTQRSDSPMGEACRNWLLFGEGSITDCGFTR